ncbi:MAG: haloacid dehalogenase [Dehalococcoidia bacterium]
MTIGPTPDTDALGSILEQSLKHLESKNSAREKALAACRIVVRTSANAIRTAHRGDFDGARLLLTDAGAAAGEAVRALADHPDIFHAGFVHDAQKELAEGEIFWHLAAGRPMPAPEDLGVEVPAYLNGLAEAVGELRRMLLDRLRSGAFEGCEDILTAMDAIYTALTSVDYPEAITGGLRRATDATRGILERTRGDLTMAAIQTRT